MSTQDFLVVYAGILKVDHAKEVTAELYVPVKNTEHTFCVDIAQNNRLSALHSCVFSE